MCLQVGLFTTGKYRNTSRIGAPSSAQGGAEDSLTLSDDGTPLHVTFDLNCRERQAIG